MPYTHAGEIGDVWKHLPVCELLRAHRPQRYFETNAAAATHTLAWTPRVAYGVQTLLRQPREVTDSFAYPALLHGVELPRLGVYPGSAAQAMLLLGDTAAYRLHDTCPDALATYPDWAQALGLADRVYTVQGDAIAAFLAGGETFGPGDFVLIDPYAPLDRNEAGQTFLDVFAAVSRSGAATVLWYGYDSLAQQGVIRAMLAAHAQEAAIPLHAWEVWQVGMTLEGCAQNPGVPGCGIAVCGASDAALEAVARCHACVLSAWASVRYEGYAAPLLGERLAWPEQKEEQGDV